MAAYRWDPAAPPTDELRRIADRQVERALRELDAEPHAAVHAARRRGKKLRALLRLVRPAAPELYAAENATLRDTMRRVSQDRDEGAALATYDDLVARFVDAARSRQLASVRAALVERRDGVPGEGLDERLAAIHADLEAARERIPTWEVAGEGFEVVVGGLQRTYRRARKEFERAYDERTTEAFHRWRKRTKYHRYHLRLLEEVWPPVIGAYREQLHALSDLLGDDHDLAVLRDDLASDPDRYGGEEPTATVCAFVDRRRAELQAAAQPLGRRCFAEPPGRLVERIGGYWDTVVPAPPEGPLVDATVPAGR
jgi:CHAD domain-containing protein